MQQRISTDFWSYMMEAASSLRDDVNLLLEYVDAVSKGDEEKVVTCAKQVFGLGSNVEWEVFNDAEALADMCVLLSGIQGVAEELHDIVLKELDSERG